MEIERKWLVEKSKIPYDFEKLEKFRIEQAYISFLPTIRIRSINNEKFVLTIKSRSGTDSFLSRKEAEIEISREEYNSLMKKASGRIIEKTRYLFRREDGLLEEIDVFEGEFSGLCYLEIEFESEEKAKDFPSPEWVEKDVTADKKFTNGSLARNGMPI